jgi:AraC-like DNA-binding protein
LLEHAGPLPPPWMAPGWVINLVVEGRADLVARGVSHRVSPGWLVLSDAGEVRAVRRRYTERAVTRSLTFAPAFLEQALCERGRRRGGALHFRANTLRPGRLAGALRSFFALVDARGPALAVDVALEGLLDAMAPELAHDTRRRWPAHPQIARARALLDERSADDITLEQLAREVGLSRTHLLRVFRREVGVAPHAYLLHRRVARARQLIAAGHPLASASLAAGFYDQSHLARHFRHLLGVTPGQYARAVGPRRQGPFVQEGPASGR